MSTKTFKSNYPGSKKEIQVRSQPGGMHISINARNYESLSIAPADAPALALAILEAAGLVRSGWGGGDDAEVALEWLHSAVARREREAKEAADREALESEAWTLYVARNDGSKYTGFHGLSDMQKADWLRTARKAREIHGANK